MYEQIEKNKRLVKLVISLSFLGVTTVYLLFFYFAFAQVGWLLVALSAGIVWTSCTYLFADRLILKSLEARPLDTRVYLKLKNVVEEVSLAAGLLLPELYVISTDSLNAMAVGRSPKKSYLVLTSGLINEFSVDELRGVVAHEMAHIKNFDTFYATLLSSMVGGATIVFRIIYNWLGDFWSILATACYFFFFAWLGFFHLVGIGDFKSYFVFFLASLAFWFLGLGGRVVQAVYSQTREFLADAQAVELTRNPEDLIKALTKLNLFPNVVPTVGSATFHFFIVFPSYTCYQLTFLNTHPPLKERLTRLKRLAWLP